MSDYKSYPIGTRVFIKSTKEHGAAFESVLGAISVFIDGETKCRYFNLSDVAFFKFSSNKPQIMKNDKQEAAIKRTVEYMNMLNEKFKQKKPFTYPEEIEMAKSFHVSSNRFLAACHVGYFVFEGNKNQRIYKSMVEKFEHHHGKTINSFKFPPRKKAQKKVEDVLKVDDGMKAKTDFINNIWNTPTLAGLSDAVIYHEFKDRAFPGLTDDDINTILQLNGIVVKGEIFKKITFGRSL